MHARTGTRSAARGHAAHVGARALRAAVLALASAFVLLAAPATGHAALVGEWHFDGSGTETSGQGNAATLGGGTPGYTTGKAGQALDVHYVSSSYMKATSTVAEDLTSYTLEAWIRVTVVTPTGSNHNVAVNKGTSSTARNFGLGVEASNPPDANTGKAICLASASGVTLTTLKSPQYINDGAWHHIVCVVDGSNKTQTLYVDGVYANSQTFAGTIDTVTGSDIRFGRSSGTDYFDGQIDEVRLFSNSLSAGEVQAEYSQQSPLVSGTSLAAGGCLTDPAATTLGISLGPTLTTADCAIGFGSTDNTTLLRIHQQDGSGSAMWRGSSTQFDPAFNGGSIVSTDMGASDDHPNQVLVQPDGKILVAGSGNPTCCSAFYNAEVVRYLPNGSLDPSFGAGGKFIQPLVGQSDIYDMALQPDGKIVLVGFDTNGSDNDSLVWRLTADGQYDTTFSGDGKVLQDLYLAGFPHQGDLLKAVTLQPDGKILACGQTQGSNYALVARFTADGALDRTFGNGGWVTTSFGGDTGAKCRDIEMLRDGTIVTSNSATPDAGANFDMIVARYLVDGTLDASFGTSGGYTLTTFTSDQYGAGANLAVQPDGKLLLSGNSNGGTKAAILRYRANGRLDPTFGTAGVVTISQMSSGGCACELGLLPDGEILTFGDTTDGTNYRLVAMRLLSNGTPDARFGSNGVDLIDLGTPLADEGGMAIGADGSLVLAGTNGYWDDTGTFRVIKLAAAAVNDYASGVNDWDQGGSAFGACLRALGGAVSAGWNVDGDGNCTGADSDPWNAVPATSQGASTEIARTTGLGQYATADLRFGLKPSGGESPGTYMAPVVVEAVSPDLSPPTNATAPTVAGGTNTHTLATSTVGVWNGSAAITYTYQWQSCATPCGGGGWVNITGATASTYMPVSGDVGMDLRVVVTATNSEGSATQASSNKVTNVAAFTPTGIVYTTGFESRTVSQAGGGLVNSIGGPLGDWSVDTTTYRNGSASLRHSPSATFVNYNINTGGTIGVARLAFNYARLPSSTDIVAEFGANNGCAPASKFASLTVNASGTLALDDPNADSGITGPTIEANRWYVFDIRWNLSGANWVLDWQLDGAPQAQRTYAAGAAGSLCYLNLGTNAIGGQVVNFDDVAISTASTDYPLGPGKVLGYLPDGVGAIPTPASFSWSTNNGGAWTAFVGGDANSSPGRSAHVNDWPVTTGGTATLWKDTAGAASTLNVRMQDTTEPRPPNAIRVIGAVRDNNNTANNTLKAFSGAGNSTIYSAVMNTTLNYRAATIGKPGGGAWTWPGDFNNIELQLSSTNATGANNAYTDALMMEADYPAGLTPVNQSPPTISGNPRVNQATTYGFVGSWSTYTSGPTYQFLRCDTAGSNCVNATGAGNSGSGIAGTYTPNAADAGMTLRVVYTVGNAGGNQSAMSAPSAIVASAASLTYLTGFEHGALSQGGGGICDFLTGTLGSVSSAWAHTGKYALRFAGTAAASSYCRKFPASTAQHALRVYVRLDAYPTTLFPFLEMGNSGLGRYCDIGVDVDGRSYAGFTNTGPARVFGPVLQLHRWYRLDMRCTANAGTWTNDWEMDGVAQATTTSAAPTAVLDRYDLGQNNGANTVDLSFDDLAVSDTAADFPIGPGKVLGYSPNGFSTLAGDKHSITTAGNFDWCVPGCTNLANADTGTQPGTAAQIDDVPMTSTSDWIDKDAGPVGDYVEYDVADSEESVAPDGVRMLVAARDQTGPTAGNTATLTPREGGASGAAASGDPGQTAASDYFTTTLATKPSGGAWTLAAFNALKFRLSVSNNAPVTRFDSVMAEADYPTGPGPVNSALPAISVPGDFPRQDMLLGVSNGTWTANGTPHFSYVWQACNAAGASCATIGGNVGTYRLTSAELGKRIQVLVTATDVDGSQTATTVLTDQVATATPTLDFLTGFEHGSTSQAGGGLFSFSGGTGPSISSGIRRNGNYALRELGAGLSSNTGYSQTPSNVVVAHFAYRYEAVSNPETSAHIAWGGAGAPAGAGMVITLEAATGRIYAAVYNGTTYGRQDGPVLTPGTWYTIDFRFNPSVNNDWTIEWRVNGADQPTVHYALPATTAIEWSMCTCGPTHLNDWYFDDAASSHNPNDYPIQDGAVTGLTVNGAGTHNNPSSNLKNDDASTVDATSPGRVDDVAFGPITDFVYQAATAATHYAEFTFSDTATSSGNALGVRAVEAYHSPNNNANNGTYKVVRRGDADAAAPVVYSGAMNTNAAVSFKGGVVTAPTWGWNPTDVNALAARVGYSSSIVGSDYPEWDALMLESFQPTADGRPVSSVLPSITGTLSVGQVLDAGAGTWLNTPYRFDYQWYRCNASGQACATIGGATSSSYTLVGGDSGSTIRVRIIGWNDSGQGGTISEATGVVP